MCRMITTIPKIPKWKIVFIGGNVLILTAGLLFLIISSIEFRKLEKIKLIVDVKNVHFIKDIGVPGQTIIGLVLPVIAFMGICGVFR